jgi:hypothetical protein
MPPTSRTIREGSQWVKVTRDSAARTFTFARGNAGDVKACDVTAYPFKYIQTWADAEDHAKSKMVPYQ